MPYHKIQCTSRFTFEIKNIRGILESCGIQKNRVEGNGQGCK